MVANINEDLSGSVALVTGASSGIGEAIVEALAKSGANVALAARRENELHAIADQIEASGREALVVPTDITDETQVEDMVAATHGNFGRLDILVNCAGVMLNENLEDADRANLRQTVEVNLLGLMNATREVLPIMQEQGTGHIVNISSLMGRKAIPGSSAYNATKSGVNSFTESLRQEVAEPGNRIRTTVIEPGLVDTGVADNIPDESQRNQVNELLTTISALSGENVAQAVLYAVTQPPHVDINEVLLRPSEQNL